MQLLPLRDGGLVVGHADLGVLRLHALLPDGRVDSGFGERGVTAVRDEALLVGRIRLVEGTSGRIAAAYPTAHGGHIAILTRDGHLDTTVGRDGVVDATGSRPGCGSIVNFPALALEDDGGIAYARTPDGATSNTAVVRLDARGRPRNGFGDAGELRFRGGDAPARALHVFLDSASNAVVAGVSNGRALLVGITSSGTLDRRFGDDGIVRPAYPVRGDPPLAAVDAAGRVLLYFAVDGDPFALAALGAGVHRFLRDGRADPSFGHASHALPPAAYPVPWFARMLTDARSRVVLVGYAGDTAQAVRFDASGTLDWVYGRASVTDLSTGLATARVSPDGTLAVLRAVTTSTPRRLDRYGESGALESSVELEGSESARPFGFVRELVLFDDGGFALCTSELAEFTPVHVWRRYRGDGTLHRAYGDGGVVRTEAAVAPSTIVVDREGTCRFVESLGGVARLSAVRADGRREPARLLAGPAPVDLALDADRRLWMTDGTSGRFALARTIPLP